MKKIITTLTAMTFALGVAAAAQAQVAKTPETPAVQSHQATPAQVAPKEVTKTGDKAKETVKPGDKDKAKSKAKTMAKKGAAETKPAVPKGKTQEGTK